MEDLEHPEWDQTIEYAWAPSDRFKERLAAHAGMLLWIADMQISGRLQIKTRGQTRWRLLKLQFIGWNAFSKCTISPAAHRQSSWCFKSKRPLSITVVFHGLDVTNLYFTEKKKKKKDEPCVCRALLCSPQKPSCAWLTRYQSTGFTAVTRQTSDGYSQQLLPCWSKEGPLFCRWCDYMLFTKSLFRTLLRGSQQDGDILSDAMLLPPLKNDLFLKYCYCF